MVKEIITYLHQIAPDFFSTYMRGAKDEQISQLEEAAQTKLSNAHRTFLCAAGATQVSTLDPFLTGCDWSISTLLKQYHRHAQEEPVEILPEKIVYFSSSDVLGANHFLQNGTHPSDEPQVGDLDFGQLDFNQGDDIHNDSLCEARFVPGRPAGFYEWLVEAAYIFRWCQDRYDADCLPPWNEAEGYWIGDFTLLEKLCTQLGFQAKFPKVQKQCGSFIERGEMIGMIYTIGSGVFSGNNKHELEELMSILKKELPLHTNVSNKPICASKK